jgi:hypothetical protein
MRLNNKEDPWQVLNRWEEEDPVVDFDLDPDQADLARVQEGLVVLRVKERVDLGLRVELRGDWGLLNLCLKLRVLVDHNNLGTLNSIRNKVLQLQEALDSDPLRIRHSLERLVISLRILRCGRM